MPELSGMIQEFLEGSIKSIGGKQPVIQPKTITENGTYNTPSGVDGFNPVVVNVPSQEPNIQPKSIFENGTYNVPSGVDGFNPVVVDVPMKEEITLNATTNGTYTPREGRVYNNVIVNVPLPQNAYLLKSVANLPQSIASFNDGQEMVMPSLKVAIEPQQEGSGEPSPTNIRPISGWDAVNVTRCGKNLWNNNLSAYTQPSDYRICPIKLENGQYTTSVKLKEGGTRQSGFTLGIAKRGDRYSNFGSFYTASRGDDKTGTITVDDIWTSPKLIIYCNNETTFNAIFSNYEIQLESGSTATAYEPYAGTTYTIDLDGTRYGGTLDVVNGIFTPAPYYASYNGETLTGEWISDRDKYEVGATPTIGAQVVNIGASGTPVSILPTAVKSLRGINNVYANTGNIKDAEYFSKEE